MLTMRSEDKEAEMKVQVEFTTSRHVWFSSKRVTWRCYKNGSLRVFISGKRVGDFPKGGWVGVFEISGEEADE